MDAAETLRDLADRVRACTRCRLHEGRTHAVPGEGPPDARIVLVGEAPGRSEDAEGRPFVGRAGRVLDEALRRAGVPRDSVFITNAVKCRPPDNRVPREDEVAECGPYLDAQVRAIRPAVIVTLGDTALRALLGPDARIAPSRRTEVRYEGIPIVAAYHPSYVRFNPRLLRTLAKDLEKAAHLAAPQGPRIRSGPARPSKPTRPTRSSGGVVFDAEGRVLLLRRRDEAIWCLPKGTIEPGESPEDAARREVREETGLDVRLLAPLREIRYSFYWPPDDANVDKTVTFYLAERVGGRLRLEAGFGEARWCSPREAARLLHYENDRNVVRAASLALSPPTGRTRGRGRGPSS